MDRTVGSNIQNQFFIVCFLLHTIVLDGVFYVLYRGVDRVDSDNANVSVWVFVFLALNITAALIDGQLDLQGYRSIHVADHQVGVQNGKVIRELGNVAGFESILTVYDHKYFFSIARVTRFFQTNLFQVQNDLGNVLNNTLDGRKLMRYARKTNGSNCKAFQR